MDGDIQPSIMERIQVWTDGCSNSKSSGWAVICPSRKSIMRGDLNNATNQQAELGAIVQAVHYFGPNITIYTDSQYAIGCFTKWHQNWNRNGWMNSKKKPVENQPLIKIGLKLGADQVVFKHVRGHTGDEHNEMADYYCKGKPLKDLEWSIIV